jgi:outer membrane PBP1 activator LpoA protein
VPSLMFQFALDPEDEARQVAQRVARTAACAACCCCRTTNGASVSSKRSTPS